MKKMEYVAERRNELLYFGTYRGYRYFVKSYGSHPCGYVQLTDEPLPTWEEAEEFVKCHGGITYIEKHLFIDKDIDLKGKFIGWDYNHYGDYNALLDDGWETYTTEQIKEECKVVIKQLVAKH